jgi:CBS domain-containing protein
MEAKKMKAKDLMTSNPACCTPETNLQQVAQFMVEEDCGCIPVVEHLDNLRPVGIITDRDICCRTVARGKNPLEMEAGQVMSSPVISVTPETSVEECCQLMEEEKIRRLVVVDRNGSCCGVIAQADIALHTSKQKAGEVVKEVSQPTDMTSPEGVFA